MIKALDTIRTKEKFRKLPKQRTTAEKVKISAFNQPFEKTPLLIVFGYRYLQERRCSDDEVLPLL